ncbi:post-segregation antitoxin (ccd killing protein) [Bradyrhizobium japonicum]|uniref:hypothetical protein n=1 Tax=Bradyrhizobium japonicum TaxID=375 RepID=UPI002169D59A|nr:hypothetical protein [Bradyrhizobium japonicum]MCS3496196.1 post-segregation antitoxin (ccd killing protein) [Bradyrhizobium japonicum]MCS3961641.1 post-segregation antitoxin (ccd killing protein) [Bradyrhizobium japonicum]MCS3993957.1 post-segregation antitoxin (ccd killing protein) [Bradyrhizobium japonicum]
MFSRAPEKPVLTIRVRAAMKKEIAREARKRGLNVSEEARRRLEAYAAQQRTEPELTEQTRTK